MRKVFSTEALWPILIAVENGRPIDVLLVEDNDVFREALELMLRVVPDIRVIRAVADGRAAVEACLEDCPDVVLMDYRLPNVDGVEATEEIVAGCDATVVVLTATADPHELDALRRAGAFTCLTKDSEVSEIVAAIRDAAARGASYV